MYSLKLKLNNLLILACLLLISASAGCSHKESSVAPNTTVPASTPLAQQPNPSPSAEPKHLVAYVLPSKDGHSTSMQDANGLVAVPLNATGSNPATAAMNALIGGTDSPLPSGTKLLSLKIDNSSKTATVDFSKQFQTNFKGGESNEAQAVNSVLQTLGQFPNIHQVQFLVAGHKIDSLGGNVELDQPLPTPQQSNQIASSSN